MEAPSVIAVFGPLMPIVVGILKMLYPKIDPRVFALGYSVGIALIAGVLISVMGQEEFTSALANVGAIGAFVFGIGTGLYKIQK